KILDLITDPTIPTDAENTLNIKKDDCSLTVKTPVDNTAVDYWTIAHYKCAKIANVALQDRYDPVIKNHLENGARNTTYISNRIQNDMLNSIENTMLLLIISNVQSKPVSIISDDTTDMGHHEQMPIVVRYFDDDTFNPVERFVGLQRLKLVDSQSIFNELSMVLKNLKIQWRDVVSVCFDGASTISGCISGVQAKCKEVNSSIIKENRIVFDFFGVVQLTYSFIEGSAIRHAVLERISADINASLKSMKSLSTTRWACRSEAVSALKHNYSAILLALEEIVDRTKQPDCENVDLSSAMYNINALRSVLIEKRNKNTFKTMFDICTSICEKIDVPLPLPTKRKVSTRIDNINSQFQAQSLEEELRVQSFFPMLDIMISGIDERFNQDAINLINAVDGLMKLKILKSKLRSTMLQERLNALMLITVEQEMAINLNPDDVIDHFKNSTQRRMVL
ncbi:uncharacterized protein LOC126552999, partial [Aphis gossypii]|uniref:uncharacterized protein LOC126552999 n=1 Tax=Aphis gossypii TaxID=80765 RepID=UPI0021599EC8